MANENPVPEGIPALLTALEKLSNKWAKEAHEADQDGDFCCALTRRNDAGELFDTLRRHRAALAASDTPPEPRADVKRLEFVRGVIEDTLADGPRPATKHQLARALRAIRVMLTSSAAQAPPGATPSAKDRDA